MARARLCMMALALASGAASPAQDAGAPVAKPSPRVVPMVAARHPSVAQVFGKPRIDLPQSAKDQGHNGMAIWTASVGPDGALTGLAIKRSSHSPAIDRAVKAWAETARYTAATDTSGAKIAGTVDVSGRYGRYDPDSPGGGMDGYRCADLLREASWFAQANAGRQAIFWPENAFVSLGNILAMREGRVGNLAERREIRTSREKLWAKLLGRCRKTPEAPILGYVDDPQEYRRLVEWR